MPVIKPARLKIGDRIGIISPAGPVSESDLLPGLDLLESAGFKLCLASHVYDRDEYLAGQDKDRLNDLDLMVRNPDIKAIVCARGGYGSLRILDQIDYSLFQSNPKIFVGFSDITAIVLAVYQMTGLVTFHGPMIRGLASGHPRNWTVMLDLLTAQTEKWDLGPCSVLTPGEAQGPLVGGNLSLICHLLGTPFMPCLDGCILFLEDRGEALYRIDRMVTHLWLSGRLKEISGIIAGQFEACGAKASVDRLLSEISSRLGIPLLTGFPLGHGHENLTLPIGMPALLSTRTLTLSMTEPCVL